MFQGIQAQYIEMDHSLTPILRAWVAEMKDLRIWQTKHLEITFFTCILPWGIKIPLLFEIKYERLQYELIFGVPNWLEELYVHAWVVMIFSVLIHIGIITFHDI